MQCRGGPIAALCEGVQCRSRHFEATREGMQCRGRLVEAIRERIRIPEPENNFHNIVYTHWYTSTYPKIRVG